MTRLLIVLLIFFCGIANAADTKLSVTKQIVDDLLIPWGMDLIGENRLIVTMREGDIVLVELDSGKTTQVSGAPVVLAKGQGGLLDVKKSPNYASDGWLYFTYVKALRGQGATTLARARLQQHKLTNWQELLVSQSRTRHSRHFGSRIAFDNLGHVYFSIGDRGIRDSAQDLTNHVGSIIRLNLDGTIPSDNPFINTADVLPEIYSYGHRNPQGLVFDQSTAQLWAIEHGPRGGDELNLIKPGRNYGWPVVSHGKEYMLPIAVGEGTTKKGFEDPIQVYIPSIAPSSLLLKRSSQGATQFFIGALKLTHLNHLTLHKNKVVNQQRHLQALGERIRNVIDGGNNTLIIATDKGQILRVAIDGG